jgi:hypothetical protein
MRSRRETASLLRFGFTVPSRAWRLPKRGLLLAFVVDITGAQELGRRNSPAHWIASRANGGHTFVRCFDAALNLRETSPPMS